MVKTSNGGRFALSPQPETISRDSQRDSEGPKYIVIRMPIEFHTTANDSARRRTARAMPNSILWVVVTGGVFRAIVKC
jgi:hypothetical protein